MRLRCPRIGGRGRSGRRRACRRHGIDGAPSAPRPVQRERRRQPDGHLRRDATTQAPAPGKVAAPAPRRPNTTRTSSCADRPARDPHDATSMPPTIEDSERRGTRAPVAHRPDHRSDASRRDGSPAGRPSQRTEQHLGRPARTPADPHRARRPVPPGCRPDEAPASPWRISGARLARCDGSARSPTALANGSTIRRRGDHQRVLEHRRRGAAPPRPRYQRDRTSVLGTSPQPDDRTIALRRRPSLAKRTLPRP